MPINYQNGKIYKIINLENKIVYIGSTAQEKLCDRFKTHKHRGGGNKIILLEDCPCSCKDQLVKKEQEYIEQHSELLNKFRAFNSTEYNKEYTKKRAKEYYNNNQGEIKEKIKKYRNNNQEYFKEYNKKYRENNKEKLKEYRENNKDIIKEKDKEYYQKNKDKIKEKDKEYYQKNKDKLKEKAKEYREQNKEKINKKVKCDLCNAEVNKRGLTDHKKTKKCIKNKIDCD